MSPNEIKFCIYAELFMSNPQYMNHHPSSHNQSPENLQRLTALQEICPLLLSRLWFMNLSHMKSSNKWCIIYYCHNGKTYTGHDRERCDHTTHMAL